MNQIRQLIIEQFAEALEVDPTAVDPDCAISELGLDSMTLLSMTGLLAEKLQCELDAALLYQINTIKELVDFLVDDYGDLIAPQSDGANIKASIFVPLNPGAIGEPVFFVHGLGGGNIKQGEFARSYPFSFPMVGIQAPEFVGEERVASFEALAKRYTDELQQHYPAKSYTILGYSLGGMLAFAMAAELQRKGLKIDQLITFDTNTSNLPVAIRLRMTLQYSIRRMVFYTQSMKSRSLGNYPKFLRNRYITLHKLMKERLELYNLKKDIIKRQNKSTDKIAESHDYYVRLFLNYWPSPTSIPTTVFLSTEHRQYLIESKWRYITQNNASFKKTESDHYRILSDRRVAADTDAIVRDIRRSRD